MNDRDRCLQLIEELHALMSKNNLSWEDCQALIPELEALEARLYSRRNQTLISETNQILDSVLKT